MSKGSAICFDFPSKDESRETKTNIILAAGAGEQMKARYSYEEMETLLSESSFMVMENLGAGEMIKLYFADYNKNTTENPMAAPADVDYVFAVKK